MELIPVITLALVTVLLVLVIILLARKPVQPPKTTDSGAISALGALVTQNLREGREAQDSRLAAMDRSVSGQLDRFEKRLHGFSVETSQQLDGIRAAVDGNLRELREDNNKKLDEMRGIVDEKLQKTLSDRMNESFRLVNERLEQVYRGLGEMQTLAQGVGDLKKVLTNVKNRGIVGEIQLGAILSDILAPEQYADNVATVPGSRNVVEFAVRLPAEDGGAVWLPIDSKFPGDTYAHLQDAQASGDAQAVENARHALELVLRSEAKDIREKYVEPPYTTAFGILFLPFEGLYAEVVNAGLLEVLQRDYQVNVAGPSTMAALLNSLQMGFKTLAIQKRSGEVWQLLGAVKTEFDKFGQGLSKLQQRLRQTDEELDNLIGVRSRAISRKLRAVQTMDDASAAALLELDTEAGRPVSARLPESRADE